MRQASAVQDLVSRRLRSREPRSSAAYLRRSVSKHSRSLPGICPGEAGYLMPVSFSVSSPHHFFENISNANSGNSNSNSEIISEISENKLPACTTKLTKCKNGIKIYLVNIQCLFARRDELAAQLDLHQLHVVCLQETWLDASTMDVTIPAYETISRRDRHDGENRGA